MLVKLNDNKIQSSDLVFTKLFLFHAQSMISGPLDRYHSIQVQSKLSYNLHCYKTITLNTLTDRMHYARYQVSSTKQLKLNFSKFISKYY